MEQLEILGIMGWKKLRKSAIKLAVTVGNIVNMYKSLERNSQMFVLG